MLYNPVLVFSLITLTLLLDKILITEKYRLYFIF